MYYNIFGIINKENHGLVYIGWRVVQDDLEIKERWFGWFIEDLKIRNDNIFEEEYLKEENFDFITLCFWDNEWETDEDFHKEFMYFMECNFDFGEYNSTDEQDRFSFININKEIIKVTKYQMEQYNCLFHNQEEIDKNTNSLQGGLNKILDGIRNGNEDALTKGMMIGTMMNELGLVK